MNQNIDNLEKTQLIKIPETLQVFWCKRKKIIIIKGHLEQKSLKVPSLLTLHILKHEIEVVTDISEKLSNHNKKKIKSLLKTTHSLIQQLLIEVLTPVYKKIKLVGVGYRVLPVEEFNNQLLILRLGYSHPIYFKIPAQINTSCLKSTQLFVYGHSYQQVTFTLSQIRLNKIPELYKGKGILYDNEKVLLKEGKKI